MQYYGINEIYKKKLLQSRNGTPYKTKISIRQVVNKLPYTIKLSKFGDMKCLTMEQIISYNSKYEHENTKQDIHSTSTNDTSSNNTTSDTGSTNNSIL